MRHKFLALLAAVIVGAGGGLLVATPAQATSCTTWAPYVGARQNRYGATVRGAVPAGYRFAYRIRWNGISSTTYTGPRIQWRTRRGNVSEVAGAIVGPHGARIACRRWQRNDGV